jgi:sugar O-acyltransferase (sialic acid O-acetyltransferase NeuD family)
MNTERMILIGAGGHAAVVYDALCARPPVDPPELRDDAVRAPSAAFDFLPVVQPAIPFGRLDGRPCHVAIGANDVRQTLCERAEAAGARLETIRHCEATLSARARVDRGCFIAARAVVGPGATLGIGTIVNHGAIVDHDCSVGEFCHVAPGAILGGACSIGRGVLIGAGAVLLPGCHIGDGASVGAGAVVTSSVSPHSTVVGVPARERSR